MQDWEATLPAMETWELAARLQIRAAVEQNFYCYDHDEMEQAYSVFTEDAVLELPPGQRVRNGRADILERFSHRADGRLSEYGYVRHNLTNHHLVALTPQAATAVSYYLVHSDERLVSGGVFYDEFVPVGGRWLISHRKVKQDFVHVEAARDA